MIVAGICERMQWTYDQYLDQPKPFLDTLLAKWEAEAEYSRIKQEQNKRQIDG